MSGYLMELTRDNEDFKGALRKVNKVFKKFFFKPAKMVVLEGGSGVDALFTESAPRPIQS